ncbi:binuclear Zn cluster-containing/DNA binding domain-containing protein [Drechmeria coniospora]|uniref:Binuclear Zn cluster-containing/DNA binding domain-containing protein n=1 Tax=Drechmeria coniospora TaxID=98403 RepID=A0A151GDK3_DRECN|nr:binuclear Zn cluster-containing/DNA binding domain-containing protein [Drechmeria coniospora]KYK55178.1 binuclear Zn cluster-containing/DNA binding domain-containing protein [Drechmeria coniospora]
MTPGREGEHEDAAGLTYPSPGAETMDAGPFYHANGRDGGASEHVPEHERQDVKPFPEDGHAHAHEQPHEHQHEHQHEHPHEHEHEHEREHEHENVQEHEHLQEQEQEQEHEHEHDQGQGEMQGQMQGQLQGQMQGQMQAQESAAAHQHVSRPSNLEELQLAAQLGDGLAGAQMMPATDPNMSVDDHDHSMRSIMPHPEPEQQQTPSYAQDAQAADHMAQHAIPVPVGPSVAPQYQMGDGIPPRKRSKVSRACDECRRKKIKCDAQSDAGDTPCSSCARASIRCLFSRVPQKRGPSKGYIKELADRIHSIENKLESEGNLTQDDIDKLFAPERPRSHSQTGEDGSRKRPFSSISTGEFSTPLTARQAPWGSEPRPIQPASASSDHFASHGFANNHALAPQPAAIKPDDTPSRPPMAPMDPSLAEADELPLPIDEDAVNDFLATIQPLYPILPSSASRIQSLLSQCPPSLRTAFALALLSVGQSTTGDAKHADGLLHEWENSSGQRTRATDIVHAQTLLLLIIDADWRGLPTLPFLLARAIALANSMSLWKATLAESADTDSEDQLSIKIWWSLVMMDRWYAAGMGRPSQIPDSSVVAQAGLQATVGEVCFHFLRLSKLLNRIAFVISTLPSGATTAEQSMASVLGDYIENYREDLPPHVDAASYPLVHLAYWHCRLLVTLLTPGATATDTMWPTKELANLLSLNGHLRSPLINHFVSLVVLSLSKLAKADSAREETTRLIKEIVDAPGGDHWDGARDRLAEQLRPSSSVEATASQGLQHLADLATAHEGIVPGAGEVAFGPSLASGYLETS